MILKKILNTTKGTPTHSHHVLNVETLSGYDYY